MNNFDSNKYLTQITFKYMLDNFMYPFKNRLNKRETEIEQARTIRNRYSKTPRTFSMGHKIIGVIRLWL